MNTPTPLNPNTVIALPADTHSEDATLASLIAYGASIDHLRAVIATGLTPAMFYGPGRGDIYEAVLTLADLGEPFDASAVKTQLNATQKATKATEAALVAILTDEIGAPTTLPAKRVVAEYGKRQRIAVYYDAIGQEQAGIPTDPASLAVGVATAGFRPMPLDLSQEPTEIAYLREPYLPRGARVWAVGPAYASKSLWALWTACNLSRDGYRTVYLSQDNPRAIDHDRIVRMRPAPDLTRLAFYSNEGFDLQRPEHRSTLRGLTDGADLLVIDTLRKCWGGDENDNAALVAFDRDVLTPIADAGTTVIVVHHTGNPSAFGPRTGVSSARGASSIGQGADVYLNFHPQKAEQGLVRIEHAKNRYGGVVADAFLRAEPTEDGGLTLVADTTGASLVVDRDADIAVEVVRDRGRVETRKALKAMLAERGVPARRADAAITRLDNEEPRRVVREVERADTKRGNREVVVYTLADQPTIPEA